MATRRSCVQGDACYVSVLSGLVSLATASFSTSFLNVATVVATAFFTLYHALYRRHSM